VPGPDTTAMSDQVTAAARHATAIVSGSAVADPAAHTPPSRWLTAQVDVLEHVIAAGQALAFAHITASPQVMHAAVRLPGVFTCDACRHLLVVPGGTGCDRCRASPPLEEGLAAAGMIIVHFSLCSACLAAAGLSPAASGTQTMDY
jgi:hypothetical protein